MSEDTKSVIEQMDIFFNSRSIAVVGASRMTGKVGHIIFRNLADNRRRGIYEGEIYPINPNEESILGYRCYPNLKKIGEEVELIVIAVPARIVPSIMEDAEEKGVKAAVIISSGFSEIGENELEERVKAIAVRAGIRVLGPNCLGVYDSYTGVDMLFLPETKTLSNRNVVIATPRPTPGNIAIVTQSGAFGAAAVDHLAGQEMGLSKLISFGNKVDVAEAEVLLYLLHDDKTKVILLYIEGITEGREFVEVARLVTRHKPVIALKAGRTEAGARAALSHTGAIAGSDRIFDGLFKQVGILRARNMEGFFDMAEALALQPPATGRNIAIVTDAGGPGIMAADECEALGLNVRRFSDETLRRFEALREEGKIPSFATYQNPVDLTGVVTSEMYELSTRILLEDRDVHGIIVLGLHHTPHLTEDFTDRIAKLSSVYRKPIVGCDIGETEMAMYIRSRFNKLGIPAYSSPEDAAYAMVALVRYGLYLSKRGYM
ncbi:MAG: CoA-binding protein [Candidatus Bathyarchaeota archaeon]|nr:MAG: CoA-binding protein [Candidatus Bathyarchaeota archaeon]